MRSVVIKHLDFQEQQLMEFIRDYPQDSRVVEANIRLAHLLITRGAIQRDGSEYAKAERILDAVAAGKLSDEQKADLAFARVSIFMRGQNFTSYAQKELLRERTLEFQKKYSLDRRVAPLLVEVAALFDDHPETKKALLQQALLSADAATKRRIDDDLKRIAYLGRPIELNFTSLQGEAIDAKKWEGKVVVICFFADWSPPSMLSLQEVAEKTKRFTNDLVIVGVSLDDKRDVLIQNLERHQISWPIYFDGKGWLSPFIRKLGINSLPTIWILDRAGNLRTLNAAGNFEPIIRNLISK